MTGEQGGDMQALVEQMAKALVDEPEKVSVSVVEAIPRRWNCGSPPETWAK